MNIQEISKSVPQADDLHSDDEGDICEECGNIYRVEWLKEGDEYKDTGHRYCPFCGLSTNY